MSEQGRTPEPFSFQGNNVANSWRFWKQKFELFLMATGKIGKEDKIKIAILLNLLGDEGIQIFNTFEYDNEGDDKKYACVMGKFDAYCSPLKNLVYEHFKFFKRDQLPHESIDQFVTALKQLAMTCEFKEADVLILDRIVLGVRDARIQEKLLQCSDLKLNQAIDIGRSMESSVATQREIAKEVSAIKKCENRQKTYGKVRNFSGNAGTQPGHSGLYTSKSRGQPRGQLQQKGKISPCSKCSLQHEMGKCSALYRDCSLCREKGHYRKCCPKRGNAVHEINYNSDNTTFVYHICPT